MLKIERLSWGFFILYCDSAYCGYVAWFFGWRGVPADRSQTFRGKSKADVANKVLEYNRGQS